MSSKSKKVMHEVKLTGYTLDGDKARLGKDVRMFQDADLRFSISALASGDVRVSTSKDTYVLEKHINIENLWTGRCRKIAVHFSKKAVVASLRYWS